jgi:carbonic anhydrase
MARVDFSHAKRFAATFVNLVHDATLRSFWRRKALWRFLRQAGIAESFLATWGPEESKREFLVRTTERHGYSYTHEVPMISAREALERLREGNHRFRHDTADRARLSSQERRAELTTQQQPFAIILGCSDSRVPAEIVFDQGLGDLFVIRVAGNIIAPSQIGSVEFAASRFGTRLVVVLGHSQCGAVLATIEELRQPAVQQSRNLRSIVDRIRPAVEPLLRTELRHDADALLRHAVRANVIASANHLRHGSEILEQLIRDDDLLVVCGEYSLETGAVEVFDGVAPG